MRDTDLRDDKPRHGETERGETSQTGRATPQGGDAGAYRADEADLRDRINHALKAAQKTRDAHAVSTLRLINTAINDRDIVARGRGCDPVGDDEIREILVKMIKQRRESAKLFEEGLRLELAEQERREIAIIEGFLPTQMNEDAVRGACQDAIRETGAQGLRDMGKCMGVLKKRYPGQMDFGKASGEVKRLLG